MDKPKYIGKVPPGLYWLGQPQEESGIMRSRKALSVAALSVAAARPLKPDVAAPAHMFTIGVDGTFYNQIWEIEAGLHGYRLKNVGTKSYLNCLNRAPAAESVINGIAGVTEWIFRKDPTLDKNDILDFWIHPSTDHNMVLGVSKSDTLYQVQNSPRAYGPC
ncbi:hypothetical protein FRC03_010346 [Tulasnella sp. 419]|nr:hypothetical protein FRC03_010346 [Tulasnella sp. 419]